MRSAIPFASVAELTEYIRSSHECYLAKIRNVAEDIDYILNVCFQVIQGIFCLCIQGRSYSPLAAV